MLINREKLKGQENYITRCIGRTTYKIKVFFSETAKETMEEKILRIIQNDVSTIGGSCDTMAVSQMSCPA